MANYFQREPIDGGDVGVWGTPELRQNRISLGIITCQLYDDSGTLKVTVGKIGLQDDSINGLCIIDTVTTISLASISSDNWFKVEVSRSGTTVIFEASDISGATDPTTIPSTFDNAYDPEKGGYYISSNKRTIGIGYKSDSYLNGIINVLSIIEGYDGLITAHGPDLRFRRILSEAYKEVTIKSGMINTSDWTNRHLGFVDVDYDGAIGTLILGETVTESVSGNTGIIIRDTGSTLTLINITGGGVFTNNRILTGGTSGATVSVDEPGTGSTKNLDSNCYHGFGINQTDIQVEFFHSIDGTYNNSIRILDTAKQYIGAISQTAGIATLQVDTNNIKFQTATDGIYIILDTGLQQQIDAEDEYYEIILKIKEYY